MMLVSDIDIRAVAKHIDNIFPPMSDQDASALRSSMEQLGQLNPITLESGYVLDGWSRVTEARRLGWSRLKAVDFAALEVPDGTTTLDFAIGQNLQRRHLSNAQKAAIGADIAGRPYGRQSKSSSDTLELSPDNSKVSGEVLNVPEAAKKLGTSTISITRAIKVKRTTPELHEAMKHNIIETNDAYKVADEIEKLPTKDQRKAAVERANKALETVKAKKGITTGSDTPKVDRKQPVTILGTLRQATNAEPTPEQKSRMQCPDGKYDVVVIDPPWPIQRIPLRHGAYKEYEQDQLDYPTMTVGQIKSIDIPLADNAWLFLWTTNKYLMECAEILKVWEVDYRYAMVWAKHQGPRMPHQPETRCEYCLIASKGKPVWADVKGFTTLLSAPRPPRHSQKPQEFYDLVARVTSGRRLTMYERFQRGSAWDTHGWEAPPHE